ncbi:hypothetical protein N7471_013827 [Penicillium samsonianum]|uniref:uncharacterized protein n=1 Tax=Penicillium samsonianum TaxID=1882272 RepID=UPI0025476657|nr:uncharacterized protein N7471_013778 [Penicillium samsonianum]XP_057129024.1 uncharacterized protein N7471_013827 [Penicillium samsonianum]KAJ6118311.1 hypothetical protein N7471_013778 [Penicillium samsonianum]KAJ6118360.1 hypothetical protein N7471_013827 [Penicillium samsonianum]
MKVGINFASIVLLLFAVLVVARPNDKPVHTATSTHPYHSSPTFPLPSLPYEMIIEKTPACVYSHGIAYMDATTENIDHLSKVSEISCDVDAGNCHRLSHTNLSGIFLCNYSPERISTNCGNLVPLATKVQQTCQVDNFYTFGIIGGSSRNASDSIDFHLIVAGESMGYPM